MFRTLWTSMNVGWIFFHFSKWFMIIRYNVTYCFLKIRIVFFFLFKRRYLFLILYVTIFLLIYFFFFGDFHYNYYYSDNIFLFFLSSYIVKCVVFFHPKVEFCKIVGFFFEIFSLKVLLNRFERFFYRKLLIILLYTNWRCFCS